MRTYEKITNKANFIYFIYPLAGEKSYFPPFFADIFTKCWSLAASVSFTSPSVSHAQGMEP